MRHPVLDSVRKFMEREALSFVPGKERILAAVSGGADSVCLLLALKELGYDVSAVHVEHGIRGNESLEDCAFVQKLCEERGIGLQTASVDVPAKAKEHGMSMEEAARLARWEAIFDAAALAKAGVIATAHHQMDQAETVLWNLIRGSSLGGLGGIRPVRWEGKNIIIRPLIGCERSQIEDFLRQQGVSWRTDSTNYDTSITRNAIRLEILPLLEQLNPAAAAHIAQTASDLRQVEDLLREQTEAAFRDVLLEEGDAREHDLTADRHALSGYPEAIRTRVLRRMIARCCGGEKDISRAHIKALDLLASGGSGHEVCLPYRLRAVSEEGVLRLTRQNAEKTEEIMVLDHDGSYAFPAGFFLPLKECPGGRILNENLAEETADRERFCLPSKEHPGGRILNENLAAETSGRGNALFLDVSFLTWPGGVVPKKKYTKYLAYDTMAPCPVLRTRRDGDYLIVNSASGRKKLKDYLIDEKVPRLRRDHIPLIAQGSHVLWVIGMRISEGARVSGGADAMRVVVYSQEEA